MCNLGEGIMEEGIAIGETRGRESGLVQGREEGISIGKEWAQSELFRSMHKNGFTAEQIAAATDKALDEVKVILA